MKSQFIKTAKKNLFGHLTRRELFRGSGLAAFAGLAGCTESPDPVSTPQTLSNDIPTYASISVRTVINCSDCLTILGGSIMR
ncbi:MAG: hypothetical protein HOC71_11350, partial [Candidatus Latescibacteria bacterium]|nr:hypothetical protein [Candidatus Latescibacterota bacterium]